MSSEVRSSHLKPPPPQELQRILADLYSSRKEDKLHTEGHKSVALVMEQQSGGNSSGPSVGQTNNNRAGDEESGMYDDNDDDDDDDDEEEDNDELDDDSIASADDFVRQIASGGMEMATVKMSRPNKKTKAKRKKKKAKRSKKRVTVARSFMAQKEEEKDLQRDNGVAVMTAGDFVT